MHRNVKYLQWVRTKPCCQCGNPETEPHHIIGIKMGAVGMKASDIHTMPLCRKCHDNLHQDPTEWIVRQIQWVIITQDKAQAEGIL